MPAYDPAFSPPAPVADVIVVHPTTGINSGALRGKLDSGADVTVIPQRLVAELGMTPRGRIWTRGYDGTYAQRLIYYVRLDRGPSAQFMTGRSACLISVATSRWPAAYPRDGVGLG
jgi:hypothetical protein